MYVFLKNDFRNICQWHKDLSYTESNSLHHTMSTGSASWGMLQLCFIMSNMPYVRYSLGGCASYLCDKQSCTKQWIPAYISECYISKYRSLLDKRIESKFKGSERRRWIISVIDLNILLKYPSDTLQRRQAFQNFCKTLKIEIMYNNGIELANNA